MALRGEGSWMRRLPNGKQISALGFGCSSIWAKASYPDAEAARMLETALAEGINHLDTSPSYGEGIGERRLADFLKGRDVSKLIVSTKVGTNLLDGQIVRGFNPEMMQASFDASMKRLGLDHVDILYLHGPAVGDLNDETFRFFERLKAQGRITWSGVNSFDNDVLDALVPTPIDAVMLQYNATDLSATGQIDALDAAGKIVISGTALGRVKYRLSAFIPRNRATLWYLARMLRHEPGFMFRARRLERDLTATGKPATEAAIQFVTAHPKIVSNLFGTSRVAHLTENARAGHGVLDEAHWRLLARRA
jgi:aryl-alcohol dehydrogenase-like predicted oxidoreductase